MNVARHHADWLSLVEVSGPFVSLPVLQRVFPQGLDARDPMQAKALRSAYEEWQDNPQAPGQQRAWLLHVLTQLLGYPESRIAEGQSLPAGLEAQMPEMGETLRPDFALLDNEGKPHLLISHYPASQSLNKAIPGKHWKAHPATRMMELLHGANIALGLVTNGEHWLLVYAPRGEATGYASWYAALWLDEPVSLRAFHSLLGVRRFFGVAEGETLLGMLKESAQDQQEVTDQLGHQVREAVEVLVQSIDVLDQDSQRSLLQGVSETALYEAALTVMMRLVFLFSAEERGLLHLGEPLYDDNYAVSTLQEQLQETADHYGEEVLERRSDAWARLLATFRAVHGGIAHQDLLMPAYGGSLFDPDRYPFLEGRAPGSGWRNNPAEPLAINNRVTLHLLNALQRLRVKVAGATETRRVSFRALGVEQIGHVYEGLLDHTARRADEPVLGLKGTRNKDAEIPLAKLETLLAQGLDKLLDFLKDETGRSVAALKSALTTVRPEPVEGRASTSSARTGFKSDVGRATAPSLPDDPATASGAKSRARPTAVDEHELLKACHHSETLLARVRPFAGLLREDSFERPLIILPGSVYVTAGTTRRSTGTHYTPPSLTEPVVQHTLEPLVYQGPAQGWPKEQWALKPPKDILALKVCDMAMGSGAFLVQACRYLAERLVEAWENAEKQHPGEILITPEGGFSQGIPSERLVPADADERLSIARRVVADRCLYGVDINPMAVEMAKLSLWLITVDAQRPFTFLDHAFKCGDSLLGVTALGQLENFSLRPGGGKQLAFSTLNLWRHIEEAQQKREALEALPSDTPQQVTTKAALFAEAEEAVAKLRAAADVLVAVELQGLKGRAYEQERERSADHMLVHWQEGLAELQAYARRRLENRRCLHWALDFPEIVAAGGFHAFVGNPPFIGGKKISGTLGTDYRELLVEHIGNGAKGNADLSAYFLLRAAQILRENGLSGLLATNTIAQGDTREVGLDQLAEEGFSIPRAIPSEPWPGEAILHIAHIWLYRGAWVGKFYLNHILVEGITPFLTPPGRLQGKPFRLKANENKSFIGSYVLGMGFVMEPEEAAALIDHNPGNKNCLFPYLNGEDLNSRPDQSPSRWVINFQDWPLSRIAGGQWTTADEKQQKEWLRSGIVPKDYPDPTAADYPDLLEIIENKVKPDRARVKRPVYRDMWWIYAEKQKALYAAIAGIDRVLAISLIGNHLGLAFISPDIVFAHKLCIFPLQTITDFSILQSSFHYSWSWNYSSTNLSLLNYSPSDCFETFPFPLFQVSESRASLEFIGERYYQHRQSIMQTRQEGLTKTYNRFHDPKETAADIAELRRLHVEMDEAVAAAYGWQDLDLGHGFHATKQGTRYTLSETARREVLDRLLELNHQRYAEEVAAGLHEKKASKPTAAKRVAKPAPTGAKPQTDLFGHAQLDVFEPPESQAPADLLDYLRHHPGWHGKDALLTATRLPDNRWNAEIKRLIDSGQVEREGEKRGARYRFRGA